MDRDREAVPRPPLPVVAPRSVGSGAAPVAAPPVSAPGSALLPRHLGNQGVQAAAQAPVTRPPGAAPPGTQRHAGAQQPSGAGQGSGAAPVGARGGAVLKAGDDVSVAVYALATNATPEPVYSRRYRIGPAGAITIEDGRNTVVVELAGLSPYDAARRIADRLVDAQLFRGPRVCVTAPGASAAVCADARTAMRPEVATSYANFRAYLRGTTEPPDAVHRYYQWIDEHIDSPEFTRITPPELWARSLRRPELPADPVFERKQLWLRFMKDRQAEDAKLPPQDRARAVETMRQFLDWYGKHQDDPDFAKADPASLYAHLSVGVLRKEIEASSRKKLEDAKAAAADSPEALRARGVKFDEFLTLSMRLWGYSARKFPYVIPLDKQGKDILVTGDPAFQAVLDDLAGHLVQWAAAHMSDPNYATVSVHRVLADLLDGGYQKRLDESYREPLAHETIDRNEILAGGVAAAFGETVAKGLLAVAFVGLCVGAGIITGGAATVILVGMAGYSGVTSYVARREEIENSGYDVSVPESLLHAAGDAVGVSQLVEGITGERLGTGQRLGSEARSTQLGAGLGNAATVLSGSRAYRNGQLAGRLVKPRRLPPGPGGLAPVPPELPRPPAPKPNEAMGPVETARRAALPANLRAGLDLWSAEIRANKGNPEKVFEKMPPERLQAQAEVFLKRHESAVAAAARSAHEAARSGDDPLRPLLRHTEHIPNTKVTVHYEQNANFTRSHEVKQAIEVSRRTGEEVHAFGDTASRYDYPGIDGTIGNPPRPMQLKNASPKAHPNLARKMAGDALLKAENAGYSKVEVFIDMPGSTVAEIKAAWDAPPPVATDPLPGPAFKGDIVRRIRIWAKDGEWTLTPPLAPARTGVSPDPARPDPDRKRGE